MNRDRLARSTAVLVLGFALTACRARGCRGHARGVPSDGGRVVTMAGAGAAVTAMAAATPELAVAERLCHALHIVTGARQAACCGGAPSRLLYAECVRVLTAAVVASAVDVDAAAVERCARGVDGALEGCEWVTPSQPIAPDACQGVVRGRLVEGATCRSSLECAENMHCTGTCARPAALGAGCGASADPLAAYTGQRELDKARPQCADFCSLTTHKCAPPPTDGASCFADVNCAPAQRCAAGKCLAGARARPEARAAAGDPCTTDFDCGVGGCVGGRCGKKCTAALGAGDAGLRLTAPSEPGQPR